MGGYPSGYPMKENITVQIILDLETDTYSFNTLKGTLYWIYDKQASGVTRWKACICTYKKAKRKRCWSIIAPKIACSYYKMILYT